MSDEKIAIEVPVREAVAAHVRQLQDVLTRRNAEIESLRARLEQGPQAPEIDAAYRRGWEACASALMESTRLAARSLGEVRADAFRLYLERSDERIAEARAHAEEITS